MPHLVRRPELRQALPGAASWTLMAQIQHCNRLGIRANRHASSLSRSLDAGVAADPEPSWVSLPVEAWTLLRWRVVCDLPAKRTVARGVVFRHIDWVDAASGER